MALLSPITIAAKQTYSWSDPILTGWTELFPTAFWNWENISQTSDFMVSVKTSYAITLKVAAAGNPPGQGSGPVATRNWTVTDFEPPTGNVIGHALRTNQSLNGLAGQKEVYLEQTYSLPGQPVSTTYIGVYLLGASNLTSTESHRLVLEVNVTRAETKLADEISTLNAEHYNVWSFGGRLTDIPGYVEFADGSPLSSLPSGTVEYVMGGQMPVVVYPASAYDAWGDAG